MKKHPWLSAAGALALGVLGSALWELIKPGVSWMGSGVLAVLSLGIDSVVDDIYAHVGQSNSVVAWIKGGVTFLLATAIVAPALYLIGRRNSVPAQSQTISAQWGPALLLLLAATLMVGSVRHTYVASTRGHFEYLLRVCAPYYTPEQRVQIESRLALVNSKAEFDAIVAEVSATLNAHGVQIKSPDGN